MKFYSTRNKNLLIDSKQAIISNLCPSGGLFMPEKLPCFSDLIAFRKASLAEIGYILVKEFFSDCFSDAELKSACDNAFNFPAPLINLNDRLSVLELTHGPSLAFKDFGARFLAEMLSLIAQKEKKQLHVLVATSGDTGGAVASALQGKKGVKLSILFPQGRISEFQKGQMTRYSQTLCSGEKSNVQTIEVQGSFDDCQKLVKEAFLDKELNSASSDFKLISANSINIARLIAQSVYYIYALSNRDFDQQISFIVPSGNLGNLSAGIFAADMLGLSNHFVSAHNLNTSFPDYLREGKYNPRSSVRTLSNAMDVGAPSNFERLLNYFENDPDNFRKRISFAVVNDEQTLARIRKTKSEFNYIACPHTAVALEAAANLDSRSIVLSTAAPKKFAEVLLQAGVNLEDSDTAEMAVPASLLIDTRFKSLLSSFK